jgi:acylpyruvate hydrolase
MKLATFRTREAPGGQFGALLKDGRLLALRAGALSLLGEYGLPERYEASRLLRHVEAFLEHGAEAFSLAYQVVERAEQVLSEGRHLRGDAGQRLLYELDHVEFLPPVPRSAKIIAAAGNFADHAAEMGVDPGGTPTGILKAFSALAGHNGAVVYPSFTHALDYEVELAAVIGRRGKNISRGQALSHVAGYTVFNDLTARDVQRAERSLGNLLLAKNFDTAGPMGPYLVTADEVPDPQHLTLQLRVNGEVRQSSNTREMSQDFAALIAHWSQLTLLPGDVITSGSPGGAAAGRADESWYLRHGDTVEASIERVGTLRNTVRPA